MNQDTWRVIENAFDPQDLHHQETVFALGNGYLTTRGSFEEGYPGAWPLTLVNGVFDDTPVVFTELANCPDWLPLTILVDGERFGLDRGELLDYRRELDLQRGLLRRELRWRSPAGRTLALTFERFVSLADQHLLASRYQVTPLDGAAQITFQAGINGYSDNQGLLHWSWQDQGETDGRIWLRTRTRHTDIELGVAMRLQLHERQSTLTSGGAPNYPTLATDLTVPAGETVTLDKLASIYSSREAQAPVQAALAQLAQAAYDPALAAHARAWHETWQQCDVRIEGDDTAQLALRYNLFQLLIATPRHDERVSIPAKTLSGFGYRGHIFWDTEIFIVPFLAYSQPELARNLLDYRYHTLPGARRKARENNYEGAMFAWESATSGDEVTPRWVPDGNSRELIRIWCGDIEHHISADVAYALWHYWQISGDDDWMRRRGAEILLDTAVFWGSRAEYNPTQGRYELTDVIGPDEYHDHVDNNTFTNRMVQWHLQTALETLAWLQKEDPARAVALSEQLDLTPQRLAHWRDIIARIWLPGDPDSDLIEQFEGFFGLTDLDLNAYEPRTRSMQAILGIEGANHSQVLKQADVLMLLYLLRDDYDRKTLRVNWDYYNPRTDHSYGSSLGPAIHAILACEMGEPDTAYQHFMRAAMVDLDDVRGNAADGIHAASAGGLWQAVIFGFGGLRVTPDGLQATPRLPSHWTRLRFRLQQRGRWFDFDLHPAEPPAIEGVIFDLDGVLTDTSELHYQAWQELADKEGIPFDRQANEKLRGVDRHESLLRLLDGRPVAEAQLQAMMAHKNRTYQQLIEKLTPADLLPGAATLLTELRAANIKIAIGSASKNARAVIDQLGIADRVDAVADGYSVERQKPAPDLFLHAASLLGVAPERCLVFEDADSGVAAALAGNMWVAGLGPAERVGAAHLLMPDLAGARWENILAQLALVIK